MCDLPSWKKERIEEIKNSKEYFGNKSKFERECWVISRLLKLVGEKFNIRDLEEAEEPVDVKYDLANFQVKEILDDDRRRGDEFKKTLKNAEEATLYADLLEEYSPSDLTLQEIVNDCMVYAEDLCKKYGINERKNMDLVFYHNKLDVHEISSDLRNYRSYGYRSISLVSNRFGVVLSAAEDAPGFLKGTICVVHDGLGREL